MRRRVAGIRVPEGTIYGENFALENEEATVVGCSYDLYFCMSKLTQKRLDTL